MEYNRMEFDMRDEKERESFKRLLDVLIDYGVKSDWGSNDIHLLLDPEGVMILEWEQVPHSGDYGGRFAHVDEDEVILKEYRLPDNSIELIRDAAEKREIQENWITHNPDWYVNAYGELEEK